MPDNKSALTKGKIGEQISCDYLTEKGYKIITRNYFSRYGEIDIIAAKDNILSFIEVKTRNNNSIATPGSFVTYSKQQKIIKTALIFLNENDFKTFQPCFDVIEIIISKHNNSLKFINHITNAFYT